MHAPNTSPSTLQSQRCSISTQNAVVAIFKVEGAALRCSNSFRYLNVTFHRTLSITALSEHASRPMLAAAHRVRGFVKDTALCNRPLKRSASDCVVLRKCGHKPLQSHWFRAAIRFYNGMLSSISVTLKQVLHTDLKIQPRAGLGTSCTPLRDCGAAAHINKPSCRATLFATQI